ncbi:MAG: tRNA (adenosine(37)-N6)-threonylcarbamoyltransferase complex transferase subunit TsaD, partial [Campylobacterales bacterium]
MGLILSIESSCDDTGVGITRVEDRALLLHRKISQEGAHSKYGGVVPELASRLHATAFPKLIEECRPYFPELVGVAVTNRPGLAVTLQQGAIVAQALGIGLGVPIIPVDHLVAHIYSLFIEKEEVKPVLVLLVSGGHTKLLWFNGIGEICELSSTLDDSVGEAFDKVAKMLGAGYPGGPVVEELARKGGRDLGFPLPLNRRDRLDFSFSGLKNAVRLAIEKGEGAPADIAYSFQKRAIDHLLQKLEIAIQLTSPQFVGVVGGVSANKLLRERVGELGKRYRFTPLYPELKWCSDNGAMVGRAGIPLLERGDVVSPTQLKVYPRTSFPKCSFLRKNFPSKN